MVAGTMTGVETDGITRKITEIDATKKEAEEDTTTEMLTEVDTTTEKPIEVDTMTRMQIEVGGTTTEMPTEVAETRRKNVVKTETWREETMTGVAIERNVAAKGETRWRSGVEIDVKTMYGRMTGRGKRMIMNVDRVGAARMRKMLTIMREIRRKKMTRTIVEARREIAITKRTRETTWTKVTQLM